MDAADPQVSAQVEVRAVEMTDAPALHKLDYSFETDRIYTLHVHGYFKQGGYVALADGQVAGVVLLNVEEWRSVARIKDIIVGRLFRRYGIGSLLLNCAADWARNRGCRAILLETQSSNYPAIRFYLRNGLQVWSISRHHF